MKYIPLTQLESEFKKLGKNFAVTHGSFEIDSPCGVQDLDWNHMDQEHRPHIHSTYGQSIRVFLDKSTALSVTRVNLLGIPFLISVTDMRLGPGLFYQSYTLLGCIYVHAITRSMPERSVSDWYIVSHPLFKPLHGWLSRKLHRMNLVQNTEDRLIRKRRSDLRAKGYRFVSDDPDYMSSNHRGVGTIPPKLSGPCRFDIADLAEGAMTPLSSQGLDILVRKERDGVRVWPGVCPHEGASLGEGKDCGAEIQCSWHGLRFKGVLLSKNQPSGKLGELDVSLASDGRHIEIR